MTTQKAAKLCATAAMILALAACGTTTERSDAGGGPAANAFDGILFETRQAAAFAALERKDYAVAASCFEAAAKSAPNPEGAARTRFNAALAASAVEDWVAADRNVVALLDLIADGGVSAETARKTFALRNRLAQPIGAAFQATTDDGSFDDGRLPPASGWSIDKENGDITDARSGARYPRRIGDYLLAYYGLNRSDGSDISIYYDAPEKGPFVSLFQFESDETAAEHARGAFASMIAGRPVSALAGQPIDVQAPPPPPAEVERRVETTMRDGRVLRGSRYEVTVPSDQTALAESVTVFDAGRHLIKLRATGDAQDVDAVRRLQDEIMRSVSPPS